MRIARDARKPIVIHTREAWDDTIALLREHWKRPGRHHALFLGRAGTKPSRRWSIGFYLSFGGIVTFPKAIEHSGGGRDDARRSDLIETDAPYLAPVPKRGKRNEPALRGRDRAQAGGAARRDSGSDRGDDHRELPAAVLALHSMIPMAFGNLGRSLTALEIFDLVRADLDQVEREIGLESVASVGGRHLYRPVSAIRRRQTSAADSGSAVRQAVSGEQPRADPHGGGGGDDPHRDAGA